jgi:hypothetical protein
MIEGEFFGLDLAIDHSSFQIFKHINYHIGIIAPKFKMLDRVRRELEFNIKAIDKNSIDALAEKMILLNNGSRITLMTTDQGDREFRGYEFNMAFVLFEPLAYELKLVLIPALAADPNSKLYTVYDR